jgi:hypothetical protein
MPLFGNGGLLGGASQIAEEMGKPTDAANQQAESYRNPLSVASFDSFGNGSLNEGEEVELARLRTPAGLERRWGYGRADQPDNQGYAYGHFRNASDESIHGKVSLQWENSTGRRTEVTEEVSSKDMDTADRYNRDAQPPVPEAQDKEKANQDEYLIVTFEPITDPANITNNYGIDAAASECRLPTTEYDIS